MDTALWNQEIEELVRTLRGFQGDQRTKYIFMDTVLSGKSIPKSEVNAILTMHGPIADNSILYEAANFFLKQCRFVGRENKKKGACDKFLFAYIGLASIRDITYTKLVSVLAAANFHSAKQGVLGVIEDTKGTTKEFLGNIFTTLSRDNGFSCQYDCPLTIYDRGLLLTEDESQLILSYVASLGITSQATVDSCKQKCSASRLH